MFDSIANPIPYQSILNNQQIILDIKRLDLVHPEISGNKFFKLKYNLIYARDQGYQSLLTFGGAYSNHIAATAYAAHHFNFQSIGIIRGEELAHLPLNATLHKAQSFGMHLDFMNRQDYRNKHEITMLETLRKRYPDAYIVPEGGTNAFAVQGCLEILTAEDCENYDVICCAVGTGGTISGLIQASHPQQEILGFSALKGDFLNREVELLTTQQNWEILDQYCFGGYAKTNQTLLNFIDQFEQQHHVVLEPIYTGKMLFGIFDLIKNNYFPAGTRILAIHSGGLQGK